MKKLLVVLFLTIVPLLSNGWGFFAHHKINRLAVFTLPIDMIGFYKNNIQYITKKASNPDMRRYIIKEEAARHYIDVDVYGDSAVYKMPRYWKEAVAKYTEDTLMAYGIVPYHIEKISKRLTRAFMKKNADAILRLSADIGHYIGDSNVPLHTTENYNGQLTNQYGIHGFWESRLPELFSGDYDLLIGTAKYVENIQLRAWDAVISAHEALDSVLLFEKKLTEDFPKNHKYGFEERGTVTMRTHSFKFSKAYHKMLDGMVERRMKASIKMVGDIWYTCWVNAGSPNLDDIMKEEVLGDTITYKLDPTIKVRNHESGVE